MAIAYILFSDKTKKFYVGSSRENSVSERLNRHNKGFVRSTKSGKPWQVVSEEILDTYTEARKRELFFKTGVGRKRIKEKFGHYKN